MMRQHRADEIYFRCTASTDWVRDQTPELNNDDRQHHRPDEIYCRCTA